MSGNVAIATEKANQVGARACSISRKGLQTNSTVMRVAQNLWSTKTAEELSARTSTSVRMARYWLARRYDISADDLTALLRSEEGFRILEAVMGDPKRWPAWFKICAAKIKEAKLLTDMQQMKLLLEETSNQTAADVAKLAGDE